MLPSMPLIYTPCKDLHDASETSSDEYSEMEISSASSHHLSPSPLSQASEVLTSQSCPSLGISHGREEEEGCMSAKALDLSVTANVTSKKSSPLKHVTPILKKYNSHRKGKGNKKLSLISKGATTDQPQPQQGTEKQSLLHQIAPKPIKVVFTSAQQLQQEGNPQSDQAVKKDENEEATEVKQESHCGAEISNGTADGSEEKKAPPDDKKTSEELKNVSAERKDNEDELAALMLASTTIRSSKGRTTNVMKKKPKQLRDMESTLTLLTPDTPAVREEKSYGFAQAYFLKVKERLDGTELYQEFLHTMNEFGTSIVDPSDLYKKVTALLNQHPDLSEEFLAFLLPEQAMQCGKFMEYLMITKMRDFFRKLEIYFQKQPQQMRKIYTNLSMLSNQVNVSIGDVRSAILPLLKGNSLLIDNFLSLLPHERPPESLMTEFEDMDFGDADNEQLGEEDRFETLVVPDQQDAYGGDSCACTCHNSRDDKYRIRAAHCVSCGTRFIHGKVFLHTGKVLRPAKVVFDAENSNDSINRLSAKNQPKRRTRRRAASRIEAANSSNSPVKHVHINHAGGTRNEVNESGGSDNLTSKSSVKSSSPKCPRTTKTKSSGATHKGREKSNAVKTTNVSKTLSHEGKGATGHRREQKQSGYTNLSRLACSKQIALSSNPVVSLRNIASNINSSSLCITVPKTSCRNSSSVQSFTNFHDRTIVSPTDPTVSSTPSPELHNTKNIILSIPTINMGRPHPVSPVVAANSSSQDVSSSEIVHDESGILPPDSAAVDSSVKDFSTLTHVIPRKEDTKSEFVCTDQLLATAGSTVENCDSTACEVDGVSKEVMDVLECKESSDTEIAVCDTTMNDVVMFEHEEQIPASEGVEIKQEEEPAASNQTSQEEKCIHETTSGSWTREEDKIILQMFQLDCSMEQTFIKISEQLPLRTLDEIRSRFHILMTLLQQMTGAKMEEDSNNSGQ